MRRARRPAAVVVSLALVVLSACGGSEKPTGPPPEATHVDVAGQTANYHGTLDLRTTGGDEAEVELNDYYYSPTVIEAPRSAKVRLLLTNASTTLTHTFTITGGLDGGIDVPLAPGEQTEVTVALPPEGGYIFFCRFHQDSGMRGALNDPQVPLSEQGDGSQESPEAPAEGQGYGRPGY